MNDRSRATIKNIEGYLPLHLAIYERGYKQLLELLIEAYPHALKETDPKGQLPIHIATRDNTILIDIIQLLVNCYPPSVSILVQLQEQMQSSELSVMSQHISPHLTTFTLTPTPILTLTLTLTFTL